jgi:hypothetical protein
MIRRLPLALFVLALVPLACQQAVIRPTPTPTAAPASPTATPSPTATRTATPTAEAETVTIRAVVYIRESADANSPDLGALETGRTVVLVECIEQWCNVIAEVDGEQVNGWVWRGCTSDPAGLLCEVRE